MPIALPIKVPDMQMMRFTTGLSPYMHEQFTSAPVPSLYGNFPQLCKIWTLQLKEVLAAIPFPPYLAYDAFTKDVSAHEL
eukprot:scaffold841_cov136-Chaetoceros_neogracile.AAC.1